ncbi:MAG: carbohydrate binding family 9 domain-containing protein, partial [Vicinamibacteria bacterium]
MKPVPLVALGLLLLAPAARAATTLVQRDGRAALDLARTDAPPRIDGRLDDNAWQVAPLDLPEWVTYNPAPGQRIPQHTEVRVVYDDAALYFAFHCVDPEPSRVRATLGRRDQLFNDDWVGLSLDAIGSRQQTYDLFVNPLGVQADILNTATAGETLSPDWVWESAGHATAEGYDVEIRLPWKSIRFTSGADVRMNVMFWRRVSRTGTSASWPELPRDKPFFENHAPMLLRDLRRPLALEVVPSAT